MKPIEGKKKRKRERNCDKLKGALRFYFVVIEDYLVFFDLFLVASQSRYKSSGISQLLPYKMLYRHLDGLI